MQIPAPIHCPKCGRRLHSVYANCPDCDLNAIAYIDVPPGAIAFPIEEGLVIRDILISWHEANRANPNRTNQRIVAARVLHDICKQLGKAPPTLA